MAHFLENDEKNTSKGYLQKNLTAEIFTDYIFTLFLSIYWKNKMKKSPFWNL